MGKLPFERQRRFVKLLVEKANITEVSTHIVRVDIKLKEPLGYTLIGHIYRKYGSKTSWTPEENDAVRHLYPYADRKDILQVLPRRVWKSITLQAIELGVTRYTRRNTSGIDETMSYDDAVLMEQLGLQKHDALWRIDDAERW